MQNLTPYLILLCLGYATGIFYVLSMIEKPIWGYMYSSKSFPNETLVRDIHAQLNRLITLLPPTMVTAMMSSAALVIYQYVSFKTTPSLVLLVVFLAQLVRIVALLRGRVAGVQGVKIGAEYGILSKGVMRLAQLHHEGLLMTSTAFILQIWVVAS